MKEDIIKLALILALALCILLCMTDIGRSAYAEASVSVEDEAMRLLLTEEAEKDTETDITETREVEPVLIGENEEEDTYAPSPLPTPEYKTGPGGIKRAYVLKTTETGYGARELFAEMFPCEDYDETVLILAKVLWGEARGVYERSKTNCACVVWCVLNRVDEGAYGETPRECAKAVSQFKYSKSYPVKAYFKELAEDVLTRWLLEKNGEEDVGRVLPKGYCYFSGNGKYNMFRMGYGGEDQKRLTPKTSEVYEG